MGSGLRRNLSCSLAACTTSNENVCGAEAGNHKGCPYSGFAGTYFHTKFMSVSPTPPIMKIGLASSSSHGRCRGLDSGLRRNDGVGVALARNSCRLLPTPPIMKMAVGAIRESPLREVFSEEWQSCGGRIIAVIPFYLPLSAHDGRGINRHLSGFVITKLTGC